AHYAAVVWTLKQPEGCGPSESAVYGLFRPAEQMFDHHLVQGLVVTIVDQFLRRLVVEAAGFLDQLLKGSTAVEQGVHPMLRFGGAEGMNVEADVFPVFPVAMPLQGAHLVKCAAQTHIPNRAILIVL